MNQTRPSEGWLLLLDYFRLVCWIPQFMRM
jgi:hypothetical protein